MVRQTSMRSPLCFLAGVAVGIGCIWSFAGKGIADGNSPVAKNAESVFGGVRFALADVNDRDWPQVKRDLTIYRNAQRIIDLRMDDQGQIIDCRLWDGQKTFMDAPFGRDGQVNLGFYSPAGTASMWSSKSKEADASRSTWYTKTVPEYLSNGQLFRWRPIRGEMYIDIDSDGQFDVKNICNDKSEITSQWVFMDGQWQMLGVFDPPKSWTAPGLCDDQHGVLREGDKEHHLDFTPGVGWKRRD
jgi:hypothetical protein